MLRKLPRQRWTPTVRSSGRPFERLVDQRRVGARQLVGIVATVDRALAHAGVAQVGEVGVVELDVAAPGGVEGGDLVAVDLGEIVEEAVEVGVRLDARCPARPPRKWAIVGDGMATLGMQPSGVLAATNW